MLIIGGTGTLGAHVARHYITNRGARHLLLTSRRGPNAPGADQLTTELTQLGAHITITACDTTDPHQLTQLLTTIPQQHPLTSIIHAAATLNDTTLTNLTPHHLHTVLTTKANTAWHLHHHTQQHTPTLTEFILFSSIAGILGNPGQANYAAANTYLDALAHHRHTQGLPAHSLAWGLWADTSTLTTNLNPTHHQRIQQTGIHPLTTTHALTLLTTTQTTTTPLLIPAHLATPRVERPRAAAVRAGAEAEQRFTDRLAEASEAQRERLLVELVLDAVAEVLRLSASAASDPDRGFLDLGFDSLTAVELRNRLTATTGLRLPTTAVFDYPTPTVLAAYLDAQLPRTTTAVAQGQLNPLDALEQLEAALAGATAAPAPDDRLNDLDRGQLARRLESLLSRIGAVDSLDLTTDPDLRDLSSASDDEIFQLIDSDLATESDS